MEAELPVQDFIDKEGLKLVDDLEPAVARYWPGYDRERVAAELLTPDEALTVLCITPRDDPQTAIGAVQFGWHVEFAHKVSRVEVTGSAILNFGVTGLTQQQG